VQKYLTVTADDFGVDPAIDSGISFCFEKGGIDNIAVWAQSSLKQNFSANSNTLRKASVGIHWNLFPFQIDVNRITDLGKIWKAIFPTKDRVEAQIRKLDKILYELKKNDIQAVFFNGHQHLHLLPGWIEKLAEWAIRNGIKIFRRPKELGRKVWAKRIARPGLIAIEVLGLIGEKKAKNFGLSWIPSICRFGRSFTLEEIASALKGCEEPVLELMTHPGRRDRNSDNNKETPVDREKQLEELSRSDFQQILDSVGYKRMSITSLILSKLL